MSNPSSPSEIVPMIVGPSLLILTGALFLWDYSGGYTVGQTWPLLLILLGLGKVAERVFARPANSGGPAGEAR
jgi:hypothetical protein